MNSFPIKPIALACAMVIAHSTSPALASDDDKQASDVWAKASLTTTYTLNRHLNPFDIDTEVHNGVATLRGTVESDVERDLAEELALGVDGIREVKNELAVSPDALQKDAKQQHASGERDFIQKVEDANVTAQIKSQLLWNSSTEGLAIDVDTRNAVVTLSGNVASEAEADLAEQIARNTDNVVDVNNKLKVGGELTTVSAKAERKTNEISQDVSDGWITTKVKSALMYNRNVDGSDINVETNNGVVTLQGKTDSDFERQKAIDIARSVKGVKSVKAELTGS